jgi:hypothetical protein
MESKFQSSFIPKGGSAAPAANAASAPNRGETTLLGILATAVFGISLLLAIGMFGYRFYLVQSIGKMEQDLQRAQADLSSGSITELVRLNDRIISTRILLEQHVAFTPFLAFLEQSTLRSVRFTELDYNATPGGIELKLTGEAQGYSALALQADVFTKASGFKSPHFSDLRLNDSGNVVFTFKTTVDPNLVSFKKVLEGLPPSVGSLDYSDNEDQYPNEE